VATLADELLPAGFHTRSWGGITASGARVQPGVYLYRMVAGTFREQRKMVQLP
jgi:hypothetical protein